jgi:S-adenosylmethionine-dependent methyltransferase
VSGRFAPGEERWRARVGRLRDVVRQELVARQLQAHLPGPPRRILDVGCGQGTQVLRLARHGHEVTGLDASPGLLGQLQEALAAEAAAVQRRVRLIRGSAEQLADRFQPGSFDAVLCHGVLMYLADPAPVLEAIAQVVASGGIVSLLVRNGDALAMRPGLLGDWATAQQAFDATWYANRIGVTARADRLDQLAAVLAGHGLGVRAWYGVRVFTDLAPDQAAAPGGEELAALLACEERAGRTDPYRRVAALTHLIAGRARSPGLGS